MLSQSLSRYYHFFCCQKKVVATNALRVYRGRNKHFFFLLTPSIRSFSLPPPTDSFAMDQAVFQTLTDTLSADTNTRLTAELRLKELQVNPGTNSFAYCHKQ